MTTTAAQSVAPAGELTDEIVRATRARYASGRTELVFSLWALTTAAVLAVCTLIAHGGASFSPWWAAFFVVLYAAASHVEFEVGTGSAIPTELVLVPMVFVLPLWFVPIGVALAFLLRTLPIRPFPLRTVAGVLRHVPMALHVAGPVLVLSALGGVPLRWSHWPVYLAALGAQFAFDFVNMVVHGRATGVPFRSLARFAGVAYAVDAALAPVGLLVASTGKPELLLTLVPLAALLRYFSSERRRRIDNALELLDAYRGTAFLLGDVVEADDAYTGSHSRHVVDLVLHVADVLRLSPAERRDAEFVALLHDVGKIRIPSELINKAGPLDADERTLMETHTIIGQELLEQVGGLIGHIGRLVRSCHERWDGEGYPDGLAGEEIPLIARIVCACDAYSAMTTDRSYRKARSREAAIAELERSAGSHFDPRVVDAIVRVEST